MILKEKEIVIVAFSGTVVLLLTKMEIGVVQLRRNMENPFARKFFATKNALLLLRLAGANKNERKRNPQKNHG
jgi:hypothetical protein